MSNMFYRAFEDRHRGSRAMILARLRAYSGFLAQLGKLVQPAAALDLGCGRGEWLELLAEHGFRARGVDLDEGMLAACRERDLAVSCDDALGALRALPDASLALVSAFHLVEHIPFETLQALITEARRVLLPGGLLIMETPNPENLVVGSSSFYMDPSHLRPIPPRLLDFVVEYGGFERRQVLRLQEAAQLHTSAPIGLIDVLDGVSPDYSVVAQKEGGPDLLAGFDTLFGDAHGFDLDALAQRYEVQQARRLDASTAGLKVDVAGLHAGVAGLNATLIALQARLDHCEANAAGLEQRLGAVLASSSWRVTAPLRRATELARQARARLRPTLLRLGVGGARRLARMVLRQPLLKRAARQALRHLPGLEARLHAMMYRVDAGPDPAPADDNDPASQLSPRAQRAWRELAAARAARRN